MTQKLILASASPRRYELMKLLNQDFEVMVSSVDEKAFCLTDPAERAMFLAREKARDVASKTKEGIVIGADTVGQIDGRLLEKPIDADEAVRMLRNLSGRTHEIITGLALINSATGKEIVTHEKTLVTFRELSDEEIQDYVKTGEPLKRAAAYSIMEGAASFPSRIDGCFYNIVGLPLSILVELLQEL